MSKEEKAVIGGKVVDSERNKFIVETQFGKHNCTLSGKLRTRHIRITVGDSVEIEIGAYSMDGRIVRRL